MTREQQVRAAMKELGGAGRADIERALDAIAGERLAWERLQQRTAVDTKKALNKIASAMHRARLADAKLPPEIRRELGLPDFALYGNACDKLRREKHGSRDHMKMVAAREARELLLKFGFRDSTHVLSHWDFLSATLYGNPRQRFSVQMKKLKKERKEGRKSVRRSKLSCPAT